MEFIEFLKRLILYRVIAILSVYCLNNKKKTLKNYVFPACSPRVTVTQTTYHAVRAWKPQTCLTEAKRHKVSTTPPKGRPRAGFSTEAEAEENTVS